MKKLFVISFIILTMIIPLSACGKIFEPVKDFEYYLIERKWTATTPYSEAPIIYDFDENGTGSYSIHGRKTPLTYEINGDTITLHQKGNHITYVILESNDMIELLRENDGFVISCKK